MNNMLSSILSSSSVPFVSWRNLITLVLCIIFLPLLAYLVQQNRLLTSTPDAVKRLAGRRWTDDELRQTYAKLRDVPTNCTTMLPPRLDRRYIVTGGSGLVGGFIIRQLLQRGQSPESIRIVDIRPPASTSWASCPDAAKVDFLQTDITSSASVTASFAKPWPDSVAHLPLTVFHTAAIIIPSERSKLLYTFPESVNVRGSKNCLEAARSAGADVFSATSSASIGVRPVEVFETGLSLKRILTSPFRLFSGAESPIKYYWQVLDEEDFWTDLRGHDEFFGNYPASKAVAERIVCAANCAQFRTGCIRPGNGVYGDLTDNMVGNSLSMTVMPTWISHMVQSFAHGANVAVAHLLHEAVLAPTPTATLPAQSGRPFVITDPGPPITHGDTYRAIQALSIHPFYILRTPPIIMLLLSYVTEWYTLLPLRFPSSHLAKFLPEIRGGARFLKPGLFTICTHLIVDDTQARKPAREGGLGYVGVTSTLEGVVGEILEWNRAHGVDCSGEMKTEEKHGETLDKKMRSLLGWDRGAGRRTVVRIQKKSYTSSMLLADQIELLRRAKMGL